MIIFNNSSTIFQGNITINPSIITDGLIYYVDAANVKSYSGVSETTGTTYNNLIGSPSGSLIGNTTFKTNPSRFDTNNLAQGDIGYLSVSPVITFTDGSEYAFETWVRIEDNPTTATTTNSLIGRGGLYPYIYLSVAGANSWRPVYREYSGGTAYLFPSITTPSLINKWNNLAFVINSSREVKFYLNGVYHSTVNPLSTYFYDISRIAGGYQTGGVTNPFLGSMTMFKIYNRVLTTAEVLQNYNATKSRY
jgi:hypothetical protein